MNQKGFFYTGVIILGLVIIAGIATYILFSQKQETAPNTTNTQFSQGPTNSDLSTSPPKPVPSLSTDKKSILADGETMLSIEDDTIFNWFKTESQLCDTYNITTTKERELFCENKTSFKNLTRFDSIVVSPDFMSIGFTIESDTLSPDTVAGIFSRPTNKTRLLTNYYLGNEFIGFSPDGANFVYQGDCFEGMCGLFIKDSETLSMKASVNNPEFADERAQNATFMRWISDNMIEYKLGSEIKQESF